MWVYLRKPEHASYDRFVLLDDESVIAGHLVRDGDEIVWNVEVCSQGERTVVAWYDWIPPLPDGAHYSGHYEYNDFAGIAFGRADDGRICDG